jgi:SAM-dependent methyltransferase
MNLLQELRSRRRDLRRLVQSVPVLGPVAMRAFRRGRSLFREKFPVEARPEIVPVRFHALYKERNQLADLDNISDPVKKLHAAFALSTVTRGRYVAEELAKHFDLRGKRYLDVGCAYGGFLVAFSEAGASQITGIDLNPGLLDYARALLEDHQVKAEVRLLDVLASDRAPELGLFDVITCNDVIEHVKDPKTALARLVSLLAPGGVLFMEIPNRWFAQYVLGDGHYQIYGISVLPKYLADRYFRELKRGEYDVIYKSLPYYRNILSQLGARSREIRYIPEDFRDTFAKTAEVLAECERKLDEPRPGVSPEVQQAIRRHVLRTSRTFKRGREKYEQLRGRDSGAADKLGQKLYLSFDRAFWSLLIQKKETR